MLRPLLRLALLLLPAVGFTFTPTGPLPPNVRGRVLDPQAKPVSGAVVSLLPHGTVLTGPDGQFAFRNVPAGTFELRVSATGYAPLVQTGVTIAASGYQFADLTLDYREKALDGVDVTDYATRWQNLGRLPEVSPTAINAAKKTEIIYLDPAQANLATNNPRQAFAKVPGITVWETDAQNQGLNISARGLSPNRSWEFNVRQDGVDISADPISYSEAYYNPPLELVERIEVVRGAGALQYGPQMGGMVNYVMRQSPGLKPLEIEARVTGGSYGLFSGYGIVGGRQGKWHYTAAYLRRQSDGWRQNSQYWLNQGFASLGYQATPRLSLRAEYSVANTRFQQPGALPDAAFAQDARQSQRSRNWFGLDWHLPSLHLDWRLPDSLHLNVRVFGQIARRPAVAGGPSNVLQPDVLTSPRTLTRDDYTNYGAEARLRGFYSLLGAKHAWVAGLRYFDGRLQRRAGSVDAGPGPVSDYREGTTLTTDFTVNTLNAAAFVENAFTLGPVIATVGLRYEHLESEGTGRNGSAAVAIPGTTIERNRLLLGVGAEWHATKGTEFYANYTQAYRPVVFGSFLPSFNANANAFNQVDPNLADATGYNLDLGYRGRVADWLQFDISGFYLWYSNRAAALTLPQSAYPDQAAWRNGITLLTNSGASRSHGVESFVEINPLKAFGVTTTWGDITVFNSASYIDASYATNRNPAWSDRRLENVPFWTIRSGLSYQREGFRLSIQHSYVDRIFTDPVNTDSPNAAGSVGVIPAYRVWDLSLAWQFTPNWEVTAGANNLLDARYATRRNNGLVVAEPRILTLGMGWRW